MCVAKTGITITFKVLQGGVHPPMKGCQLGCQQDQVRTFTTNSYHGNWPVLQQEFIKCLCGH